MSKFNYYGTTLMVLFFLLATFSYSQKKLASPRDSVSGRLGGALVCVNYGSPAVKGRVIWGRLVPYGQIWRAGANEATRIKFDKAISVQGKLLPAGEYALFAIPGEKEWTIIFNKSASQWGVFEYNDKEDALRVQVIPESINEKQEHLRFLVRNNKLVMEWDSLAVPLTIKPAP